MSDTSPSLNATVFDVWRPEFSSVCALREKLMKGVRTVSVELRLIRVIKLTSAKGLPNKTSTRLRRVVDGIDVRLTLPHPNVCPR
jgi:hypothetical protein